MSVPLIKTITAFDATMDYDVTFTYDGNQVHGHQIQIYENSSNNLVYDNTVTSFVLRHTIPANTLSNGITYYLKIRVFDVDSEYSSYSEPMVFTCHATPTISCDVQENQIVKNSYLDVNVSYSTSDEEYLNTWQLILYDSGKTQISITDIIYASSSMSTRITGLEDSTEYYIQIIGTTVNSMSVSTDLIPIQVEYIRPSIYSKVALTNNKTNGTIEIQSNLVSIIGVSNPDPPTYINNSEIDLTTEGSYVYFDEGFNIENDFSLEILGRNFIPASNICTLTNGTYSINIKCMSGTFTVDGDEQIYFVLTAENSITVYRIVSNLLPSLSEEQQVYINVKKKNNLYDIVATLAT